MKKKKGQRRRHLQGKCPLCGRTYTGINYRTNHHIYYPRKMFDNNVKVPVCLQCHEEFNKLFPFLPNKCSKRRCLINWRLFCISKHKSAFKIYPQLKPNG